MRTKSIEQFTDLIACDSEEVWRDLIFKIGKELGYERTLLAILPDRNTPVEVEYAFLHTNYSIDWLSKYDSLKLNQVDPVVRHCANKSTPLIWTPDIFSAIRQKEMYEEACGHGLRSGVTLPIHGSCGEMGILCFVNGNKPGKKFQKETCHVLPELSYLRDVIFETSLPFMKPSQLLQELPHLTPRELECLKWCAAGKSSWDIAQILHCSEAAVNFHFANLRRKFCVKSRQQVVVKAITQGLIAP